MKTKEESFSKKEKYLANGVGIVVFSMLYVRV